MQKPPVAVLLLNLGGPASLDDVEPFLYNLFSDRMIIRLGPSFMQRFIAKRIARKRAAESRANYEKIGGFSPINKITSAQGAALSESLSGEGDFMVLSCMRYWHPFTKDVVLQLKKEQVQHCIALPLYPHYSLATTGSSLRELKKQLALIAPEIDLSSVKSWPTQEDYIRCLSRRIIEGAAEFGQRGFELVYSAHSLPQKFIDEGDPYVMETRQTIEAVEQITGIKGHLCFQSRSGPVKWIGPSTPETLHRLAAGGTKNILMVPISFVSDHIETLYEIDILYRDLAHELGMELKSTPGLNTDPDFIGALKKLVLARI